MNESLFSYTNPASRTADAKGALAGSRLAIPPNLSVRGWPTEAGSRALEKFVALEDATVVERLRSAGAWIPGTTRIAELAFGLAGDTSAAAVASSQCDAALVTDTLGEVRVAAAEAGLIGFKPTVGTISRYGLIGLVPSMECLGILARDIPTISKVLETISGSDRRDFSLRSQLPNRDNKHADVKSIAVIPESLAGLGSDEKKTFEASLATLNKAGLKKREVSVGDYELIRNTHQAIAAAEASSAAGKYDSVRYGHRAAKGDNWNEMYLKSRGESFGPLIKLFLFQGAYFQFKDYPAFENACRLRRQLTKALESVLSESDVIVLPTTRKPAGGKQPVTVSQVYDAFALTLAASLAGLPAISLPGFVKTGADDLGLQLIARPLEDNALLAFAAQLLSSQKGGL